MDDDDSSYTASKTTHVNKVERYNGKPCFALFIPCVAEKCSKEYLYWDHLTCHTLIYIDVEGDLLCSELIAARKCRDKYFLQDAKFSCLKKTHGVEFEKLKSLSDYFNAVGNAIIAIQNKPGLGMKEKQDFVNKIQANIKRKWVDEDDD